MNDDEKAQIDKFKEAARELECDDDGQRFTDRLRKLVRSVPKETASATGGDAENTQGLGAADGRSPQRG